MMEDELFVGEVQLELLPKWTQLSRISERGNHFEVKIIKINTYCILLHLHTLNVRQDR